MENNDILKLKSDSAIQAHVSMLQGIINRLSEKSSNCKSWCVGIISAIFVLLFSSDKNDINIDLYWMYYTPVFLFLFLNCYYLGQERMFIKKQNDFVDSINKNQLNENEIFLTKKLSIDNDLSLWQKAKNIFCKFIKDLSSTIGAFFSFSIIIFYGASFIIVKIVIDTLLAKASSI